MLLEEMELEIHSTRKMCCRIPNDKSSRKPHEKSISVITNELLELFERSLAGGKTHQDKATEDDQPKNIA